MKITEPGIYRDFSEAAYYLDPDMLRAHIEHLLRHAQELEAKTPVAQWQLNENNELSRLVAIARNRWALDNDEPVEPVALAHFGGVSEGRIRNMMSGANRTFASDDGKIPHRKLINGWPGVLSSGIPSGASKAFLNTMVSATLNDGECDAEASPTWRHSKSVIGAAGVVVRSGPSDQNINRALRYICSLYQSRRSRFVTPTSYSNKTSNSGPAD